jgi:hypothetical protein
MTLKGREGDGATAKAKDPPPEPPLSLEFVVPVAEAARLARFPILAALREGRISTSAEEIRWLDTPSGALSAAGTLLEAPRRGPRRLITLAPAAEAPWYPGQILSPDALLSPNDMPEAAKGEALTALVAFTGKKRSQRLLIGNAVVALSLIQGHLRAVAAEREVARVNLTGPAPCRRPAPAAAKPKPGCSGTQPCHRADARTAPTRRARYVRSRQRGGLFYHRHRAFAGSGAALRADCAGWA